MTTKLELDYMEYATDGAAQAAYVCSDAAKIQSYSEGTIKTQGTYSLKAVAQTTAIDATLMTTFSPSVSLGLVNNLKIDMRSSRVGSNLKLELLGAGSSASATGGEVSKGTCIDLTGNIYITLSSRITHGTNATINCWVKDYALYGVLMGNMDTGTSRYLYNYTDGGWYTGSNSYPEQVNWNMSGFDSTGWHMFTLAKTDTTVEFFFDGASRGTKTLSTLSDIVEIGRAWGLGTQPGQDEAYLNTKMDELSIWNRALSNAEIVALYNNGVGITANSSPINAGLIHNWQFEERMGTVVFDSVGGNHGTLSGPATWAEGMCPPSRGLEKTIYDGALSFGGTYGDWVKGPVTNLPLGNATRTVSAWFKATSIAQDHSTIVSYGQAVAGNVIILLDIRSSGSLYTETGSGANAMSSANSVLDGVWHLGVLTYDGTYLRLYLDGIVEGTSSSTYLETLTSDFDIGDMIWATGYPFQGTVGQVCVWDRALSDAEVAALYNNRNGVHGATTVAPFNSGLLCGYNMNEGTDVYLTDFSGNNNTLTITNVYSSIAWTTGAVHQTAYYPVTFTEGAYTYHVFYTSGTLTTSSPLDAEIEFIAGGGGGACGGGGAGGHKYSSSVLIGVGTHDIVVGNGGAGATITTAGGSFNANDGEDTYLGSTLANGGGGGANTGNTGVIYGNDGGSGGGGGAFSFSETFGGTATPAGQGYNGGGNGGFMSGMYPSGGGGGASEIGGNATADGDGTTVSGGGGDGIELTILPGNFVCGGGGGTSYYYGTPGAGGVGGGGNGGDVNSNIPPRNGVANTGGGGGGAPSFYAANNTVAGIGAFGGSGIAIIKYLTPTVAVAMELTPNIVVANQWQTINWSLSTLSESEKAVISGLRIRVVEASAINTFYVDNFEIAQAIDVVGLIE